MTLMNCSAFIVTMIGVLASFFTVFMNVYLLTKHRKKKEEMVVFYCRFTIDVFIGMAEVIFLIFIMFYAFFDEFFVDHRNFIIYFGLPVSTLGSVRSIVTLAISVERFLAVYFPIFYHNYQGYFSPSIIVLSAIGFGFMEPVFLFGICQYNFEIPLQCAALICGINQCFFSYMNIHKSIVYALIFALSLLLCLKLLILNKTKPHECRQLSRVNRLALIDAGIVFVFDFLPNITRGQVSKYSFFSFHNIGPYGAISKCVGCAMEAYLVFKTLSRKDAAVETKLKYSGDDNRS